MIKAVSALRSYAFFHFHTEENYLAQNAYPKLFKHFHEHDAYLTNLQVIVGELIQICEDSDCKPEPLRELAASVSDWAAHWWESHILEHDKDYAEYIKKNKGRSTA